MKPYLESLSDLEAAFEAVKGKLFGPLDPTLVKLKHKEIIQDAKEKRDQEIDPRRRLGLTRDDPAERDRKDRQDQTRTLTWLLANDRLYREAHERAMASIDDAALALARAIEAGERASEKLRRQMEDYLGSTPRLKDGRYVMVDKQGRYWDQDSQPVSAEDAAEVDGQPKRAFKSYDDMRERKDRIDTDLAKLRGWDVEIGSMKNDAADNENPTSREKLDDMKKRADDLTERARDYERNFESASNTDVRRDVKVEHQVAATASMAVPQL